MVFDRELNFFCDTLKKLHVNYSVVTPSESVSSVVDPNLLPLLSNVLDINATVYEILGKVDTKTVYKVSNSFRLNYMFLSLPESASLLIVGPYLSSPLSARQILEIAENNRISPKNQKFMETYYTGVPVLSEGCYLFLMLDTLCETMWGADYNLIDTVLEQVMPASPINGVHIAEEFDDVLLNMKAMEQRYACENELMQAVSLGQSQKAAQILAFLSQNVFEKRVADPVRNMKNYLIIMNTLLRKAAEQGGVHPVYLDRVSSGFAFRLEQVCTTDEAQKMMSEMFKSYCRLVRKHSMKDYSPVVQKAVLLIESDLSANLALSSLAADQKVSPGYLSTIFKKETGKTVTEYIRDRRMKHATHLLSTTKLQVQTIALHCGIMDVQYFSKIFKRQIGMTPKEYRESMK